MVRLNLVATGLENTLAIELALIFEEELGNDIVNFASAGKGLKESLGNPVKAITIGMAMFGDTVATVGDLFEVYFDRKAQAAITNVLSGLINLANVGAKLEGITGGHFYSGLSGATHPVAKDTITEAGNEVSSGFVAACGEPGLHQLNQQLLRLYRIPRRATRWTPSTTSM